MIDIGVYQLVFPNGEFYIGSAWGKKGIEGRWNQHRRGDVSSPRYLQELAAQCGWKNVKFVILKIVKDRHRSLLWEQAYIYKYWDIDNKDLMLMNKNRNVLEIPAVDSSHFSEEVRQKISRAKKGKSLTEEHKKKISESLKGEKHPMFSKHLSDEHKKKISESSKGRIVSEGTRRKIGVASSGINNGMYGIKNDNHPRAVLTWTEVFEIKKKYHLKDESGKKYYSQRFLAMEYKVSRGAIQNALSNSHWIEKECDFIKQLKGLSND